MVALYCYKIETFKGFLAKKKLLDPTTFLSFRRHWVGLSSSCFAEVEFVSGLPALGFN